MCHTAQAIGMCWRIQPGWTAALGWLWLVTKLLAQNEWPINQRRSSHSIKKVRSGIIRQMHGNNSNQHILHEASCTYKSILWVWLRTNQMKKQGNKQVYQNTSVISSTWLINVCSCWAINACRPPFWWWWWPGWFPQQVVTLQLHEPHRRRSCASTWSFPLSGCINWSGMTEDTSPLSIVVVAILNTVT